MCGSKCRAGRSQQQPYISGSSLIAGLSPLIQNSRGTAIENVLHAYSTPPIASNMVQQPQARDAVPAYTAKMGPNRVLDTKQDIPDIEPPAYEKVAGELRPEVATRVVSNNSVKSNGFPLQTQSKQLPSQFQASPEIERLMDLFSTALASFQSGRGKRHHVRRAQKHLRDGLYEAEIARRTAMYGRLRCGEKCEVWREVKAIDFGY